MIGGLNRIKSSIDEHLAAGADQVCLQVLTAPSDLTAAWKELSALAAEFRDVANHAMTPRPSRKEGPWRP